MIETTTDNLQPNPSAVALYDVANHEKTTETVLPQSSEEKAPSGTEKSNIIETRNAVESILTEACTGEKRKEMATDLEEGEIEESASSNDRKRQRLRESAN